MLNYLKKSFKVKLKVFLALSKITLAEHVILKSVKYSSILPLPSFIS